MRAVVFAALACLAVSVPLSIHQDDASTDVKTAADSAPPSTSGKLADMQFPLGKIPEPNMPSEHYPVPETSTYSIKTSSEVVAGPFELDAKNKSAHGVPTGNVTFDRPEDFHPMEVKTPVQDSPCDPDRIIQVEMPALEERANSKLPYLPLRYGCSDEYELSREKASPLIKWTNLSDDVQEVELQLVSMGDSATCPGVGEGSGKILWHVDHMTKVNAVMSLEEGSSHDKRMLNGGVEEVNQWLEEYYSGPCPAAGTTECYRVKVLGRRNGKRCLCGHKDFLFERPDRKEYQPWVYNKADIAPVGTANTNAAASTN